MYATFVGPWKKKNLADFGIVTQCMAPTRVNDQYLTNCLLKINAKVRLNKIILFRKNYPEYFNLFTIFLQ